jgi:hypothetical protein
MFCQVIQKVFDKAAQHMYIIDFTQIGQLMTFDKFFFQLFDCYIGSMSAIKTETFVLFF